MSVKGKRKHKREVESLSDELTRQLLFELQVQNELVRESFRLEKERKKRNERGYVV